MIRRLASRLRGGSDEGYALLVVLGVGVMLLALVATSLTVAASGYRKSGTDDDWNAALSAAYGGLEEYRSRLANDSTYVGYGNPAAGYTSASGSIVTLPAVDNPAFGIGEGGAWAEVPGSDGQAAYRYEVDNSDYASSGSLRLRVTGRAGDQTRSIVASLRQSGFIDYLYFTDFEVFDPRYTPGNPDDCDRYAYSTPGRGSDCITIEFQSMDVMNGPMHSNDRLRICGGTFNGPVTTSSLTTPLYSCGGGTFAAGPPTYQQPLDMPPTNGELKKETRNDLPEVARPGCLYTGPTTITFHSNGTMTVVSPWTKRTNVSGTAGGSAYPAACGLPGTGSGRLGSAGGATVPVMDENLVYVQNVPALSTDPNYWPPSGTESRPPNFSKLNGDNDEGYYDVPEGWQFHSTRYPASGEGTPRGTGSSNPAYGWKNGDVFVRGVLNGATTVAAENFVYITGNLTYADTTDDVLGLVGQNAVWVRNPINPWGTLLDTSQDRSVHAAIISVDATFTVQNYQHGPARGSLTVLGAIAQKFRGPVATGSGGGVSSGYAKNYSYDTRLRNIAPPKFLTPVSTTYGVTQVAGVPSAYAADGTAR